MKRNYLSFIPVFILLLTMSIGGVQASFIYSENAVPDITGGVELALSSFVYNVGNGSFDSKEELKSYLTDPSNSSEVSEKFFANSLNISTNDDGSIALSSPSATKRVMFTAEFIYELQQLGISTIVINDFSTTTNLGATVIINYTDYTGQSQSHWMSGEWRMDISSPALSPIADGGYSYTKNGKTSTAQNVLLNTNLFDCSWTMGSVTFE